MSSRHSRRLLTRPSEHYGVKLKNQKLDLNFENPCDLPMLRKLFRPTGSIHWTIGDKETVEEFGFRTTKVRNRLMLELTALGVMGVGGV